MPALKKYLICSFIVLCKTSIAQDDNAFDFTESFKLARSFRDFLEITHEPSTMSGTKFTDFHSGIKKAFLFNGDFQLPVTLGGINYTSGKNKVFFQSIQFIPAARVRIFQNDPTYLDKSKPVRTPSYYPKLTYYATHKRFWNQDGGQYVGLGFGHHSNGQDGTEFVDYTDTVNIYNGSFSESLIAFALIGGKQSFKGKKDYQLGWKIGYEHHPAFFANQKFFKTGVYGGNRFFASIVVFDLVKENEKIDNNLAFSSEKEENRLSLNLEYISDLSYYSGGYLNLSKIPIGDAARRLNINLTYYKRFLASRYPALFAQIAYYGSDNYNIYFQKSFFQARIGIAFGFFVYNEQISE